MEAVPFPATRTSQLSAARSNWTSQPTIRRRVRLKPVLIKENALLARHLVSNWTVGLRPVLHPLLRLDCIGVHSLRKTLPLRAMAPPLSAALVSNDRVLSIQSHTVQGYVGNKSAVFPLQLLGFEVDPINSVQFSNHTGYPVWRGDVLNGDQLWALIEGLEANGLLFYTHLLTGYIGSLSFLEAVIRLVEKLRTVNPNLIYVCDPVMGDHGQLYVPSDLVPVYREQVVRLSSMLTPNQFEAQLLTGCRVETEAEARRACSILHAVGPSKVVITSLDSGTSLLVVGSHQQHKEDDPKQFKIRVPKLPLYFTGAGDLITALLLGWSHKYPNDLDKAAELAVSSLQAVLEQTLADYKVESGAVPSVKALELSLIRSRHFIMTPSVTYHAEKY